MKRAEGGKERGGLRRVVSTYNSLGMNIPATNNNNKKKKNGRRTEIKKLITSMCDQ